VFSISIHDCGKYSNLVNLQNNASAYHVHTLLNSYRHCAGPPYAFPICAFSLNARALQVAKYRGPDDSTTDAAAIGTTPQPVQGRRHSATHYKTEDSSLRVGMIRHSTQACDTFQAPLPCSLAVQQVSEQILIWHVTLLQHSMGHRGVPAAHQQNLECNILRSGCHLLGV
jgi:hypothetical protein